MRPVVETKPETKRQIRRILAHRFVRFEWDPDGCVVGKWFIELVEWEDGTQTEERVFYAPTYRATTIPSDTDTWSRDEAPPILIG